MHPCHTPGGLKMNHEAPQVAQWDQQLLFCRLHAAASVVTSFIYTYMFFYRCIDLLVKTAKRLEIFIHVYIFGSFFFIFANP